MRKQNCDEAALFEYIDKAYAKIADDYPYDTKLWPKWAGTCLPEAARRYHIVHSLRATIAKLGPPSSAKDDEAQSHNPSPPHTIAQYAVRNDAPATPTAPKMMQRAPLRITPLVHPDEAGAQEPVVGPSSAPLNIGSWARTHGAGTRGPIAGPSSARATGQSSDDRRKRRLLKIVPVCCALDVLSRPA